MNTQAYREILDEALQDLPGGLKVDSRSDLHVFVTGTGSARAHIERRVGKWRARIIEDLEVVETIFEPSIDDLLARLTTFI